MQGPRLVLAFVVFAVIAVVGAIYWYSRGAATSPPTPGVPTTTSEALIGGPFSLVAAADGRRVTEQDLRGRFSLVYFGYTFCPDVCPMGLDTVTRALELLPPAQAERVQPVFVTIDPARDTPEVMRQYAASFHPRLLALTGSEAEIQGVLKAYRVYARKAEGATAAAAGGSAGGYLVDHSSFTYLMGPDGRYVTHFSHGATPEEMAKRLGTALGEAAAATS